MLIEFYVLNTMDPRSWTHSAGPGMLRRGATDHRHERTIWVQPELQLSSNEDAST